jgi:hypothetical protein
VKPKNQHMKKFQINSFKGICLVAFLAISFASCKEENATMDQPTTSLGDLVLLCHGNAQSFVTKDANGNPQSMGFTFTEDALTDLPDVVTETPIPLPKDNGTVVDHISVDYNPHGHEPVGIYDKPHFDFHFYFIPEAEQMLIDTGAKMEVLPAAEFIPPSYQPTPSGVPMMGKHWGDVTSGEFNGKPFDRTYIYGSYNGKFIFHEPMVTLAFLQSKQNFTDPIKQQAKVQIEGYYPTTYSVSYDADKKMYTVTLGGLTLRHI